MLNLINTEIGIWEQIFDNPYLIIALVILIFTVIATIIFIYIKASTQGCEISFWPPKIGPKPEKKAQKKSIEANLRKDESFAVIEIMKAHDLWSDFEGIFYAWNPSWQTEIVTNPSKWINIHERRYTEDKIERVIYVILNNKSNRVDRKHYYLDGFKIFLKRFVSNHPLLKNKISEKMEIYIDEKSSSDLTFFVGNKHGDDTRVGLLLINELPFCKNGTPILAFETKNKRIISEMINMFHGVMTSKRYYVDDILNDAIKPV